MIENIQVGRDGDHGGRCFTLHFEKKKHHILGEEKKVIGW